MFLRLISGVDLVIIKMIHLCRHVSFFILVLDEDLESKDVKIDLSYQINILDKDIWIVKNVLACVPLSSYLMT